MWGIHLEGIVAFTRIVEPEVTSMSHCRRVTTGDARLTYPCVAGKSLPWSNGLEPSRAWFERNLGSGVEGFHAFGEDGTLVGHLYWCRSEQALIPYRLEPGTGIVLCEWVDHSSRGKGIAREMYAGLAGALTAEGRKGIFAEATGEVEYMHRSHFEKRGFRAVLESSRGCLMYLPLIEPEAPPSLTPLQPGASASLIPLNLPRFSNAPVEVVVVGSLFCPVSAFTLLILREVVPSFGGAVRLVEFEASRQAVEEWGAGHGIFVNGRERFVGPVSEAGVLKTLDAAVRNLP